jgi:hypothetical protein
MSYNIKRKGRPRQDVKVRNIAYITPKGFTFKEKKGDQLIFEKK